MAIVGLKSPLKKRSPMKAIDPVTAVQLGTTVLGFFGKRKAKREAARRDADARARLEEARKAYMDIEFTNPYEGLTNPYSGMTSQYEDLTNRYIGQENVYEDLTVDQRASQFAREQSQQAQANILSNLGSVAGSSGVAGLAQSLANVGAQQARQASLSIAQQERQNQMLRQQEASRLSSLQRGEASRLDLLKAGERGRLDQLTRSGDYQTDMLRRKGEQFKQSQEQQRIEGLYGLSAQQAYGASLAADTAQANQSSAFGDMATSFTNFGAEGGFRSLYETIKFGGPVQGDFEPI